jgi:hypothetical protein
MLKCRVALSTMGSPAATRQKIQHELQRHDVLYGETGKKSILEEYY